MSGYNLQPQTFNAYGLASLYLRTAGLPDTPRNRRILAAWFRAESAHVGQYGVLVYNNNPLNYTCTSCSNYHQFSGNNLKFVNYSGTTAGAQAWAAAINRPIYKPIKLAFQAQDWAAFQHALRAAPWGTSANTWKSSFNALPDNPNLPQGLPNYADNSSYSSGSIGFQTPGGDTTPTKRLSAFNGLYSHEVDKTFTRQDALDLIAVLEKNGWFGPGGPASFVAESVFIDILGRHVGEKWNQELLAKIAAETGVAAVNAGHNPVNDIPVIGPTVQLADRVNHLLDPANFGPNMFHIVGIALGFGLVFYGIRIIFRSAGVEGISSGNTGGNSTTIIESETRYPMVIKEGASESPQIESPAPRAPIRRRRTAPIEWGEVRDNTGDIPASNTIAPLKKANA